ncbi:MAG: hypothetical protein Q3Y08_07035 [Butyricicoccus sp.]|nr:hypothetical protein [Butyricicoccus sp.]
MFGIWPDRLSRCVEPPEENHILNTLARICEARGTDAAGIAYHEQK